MTLEKPIVSVVDVADLLQKIVGYKGLPFPGAWIPWLAGKGAGIDNGGDYESIDTAEPENEYSSKGTALYKRDMQGNYYFMPVTFIAAGKEYDIDCALVSITGKKNIVETPLVGRKGSVKELISLEDYQISITGAVIGYDNLWPEQKLDEINELYAINEAVELRCALTAVFLAAGDKVVITSLSIPAMPQVEHVQVIELQCVTDQALELIME